MLRDGQLVAGKYRIEQQLGEGGMGYVVSAIHEALQQRVAIKFLAESHAKNPDAAARFLREARTAVRVQSEHVARVLDVGALEDGSPYMVMEFLHGSDLADELDVQGKFSIEVTVNYLLQACEAVAEAHSLGLVHRDLKPANLFLTRRADGSPLVKVLDFGISKALESGESATLTSAQAMLGSPAYMSPEQARTPKSVDTRTDIWSLGVILYEFLVGETPFKGETPLSLLTSAFSDPTPSLRVVRSEAPPELEHVINRCLEKLPQDRYQSVAELAQALAPFGERFSQPLVERIQGIMARPTSSIPPSLDRPQPLSFPRSQPMSGRIIDAREEAATILEPSVRNPGRTSEPPGTAETLMDWGKSEDRPNHSRRRWVALGGVGLVGLTLVGSYLAFSQSAATPAIRPAAEPTHAPAETTPPPTEPAPIESETPADPEVTPSVTAASNTPPAESAPEARQQPAIVRQVPVQARPQKVPVQPHPDPLDGRR